MIDVEKEEDIEQARKDNPLETIRWVRPDGYEEYHEPHGQPVVTLPPRRGRGGM